MKRNKSLFILIILIAICGVIAFPAKIGLTTGGKIPEKSRTKKIEARDRELESHETVFAVLNPDGTIGSVTSSNWVRVGPGPGNSLYLPGNYQAVENLRGPTKPTVLSRGLNWPVNSNRLTDLNFSSKPEQTLPVKTQVSYYLNGRKVEPCQVVGKGGTLKIKLTFKNMTAGAGGSVPLLLNVSTEFPYNKYSKIQAQGATTVLVGKDLKASWILFPHPQEEINITLKGKDFQLKGFEVSVIPALPPMQMVNLAPQLAALLAGMEQIEGGLAKSSLGAGELAQGTEKLAWGLASLQRGLADLGRLSSAQRQVANTLDQELSSAELVEASKQLLALTEAHRTILSQTEASLAQVPADKLAQTPKQLAKLAGSLEQLTTGSQNLAAALAGQNQILTAARTQNEELEQAVEKLARKNPSLAKTEEFAKIRVLVAKQTGLLATAQNGNEQLPGVNSLTSGAKELEAGLEQAAAGLTQASKEASPIAELGTKIEQLKQALAVVLRGGELEGRQIPGMDQLARGLERFSMGLEQLKGGVTLLARGGMIQGQQLPGLNTTANGLGSTLQGTNELAAGSRAASAGSNQLAHGLGAIQSQGTGRMIEELSGALASAEEAQKSISSMKQRLAEYDNFSGKPQGAKSQVRFLLKIKAPGEA